MEAGFYAADAVGSLVGDGVTGAREVQLRGIVKTNGPKAELTVVNEYICGVLAAAAGLPVPPGTIAKLNTDEYAYVMLRFGLNGDKPPPADVASLVLERPRQAALVAVFDCWVRNGDRHSRNLAFIPGSALSIFDHGHALLGTVAADAAANFAAAQDQPLWLGEIIGELASAEDLLAAVGRMRRVPEDSIEEACDVVCRLGLLSKPDASSVAATLMARQKQLWYFVDISRVSFAKITDWGLPSDHDPAETVGASAEDAGANTAQPEATEHTDASEPPEEVTP